MADLADEELLEVLQSDPRVRAWLQVQLLSTKEAAEILGVERPRIWRWEQSGRITRVATTKATPVFLRFDVERLREENFAAAAS